MYRRLAILILLVSSISQAAPRLSLLGAGDLAMFSAREIQDPSDLEFNSEVGYGGGFTVAVPLGYRLEIESGGIFLIRKWRYSGVFSTTGPMEESLKGRAIEVPLLLRLWFGKGSFVLGGVASSGIGKVKSTVTAGGVSGPETEVSYGDLSLDNINMAVAVGFGYRASIGASGAAGFLMDLRYQHGLRNRFLYSPDSRSGEIMTNEIRLLMGLTFGGPKR